MNNIIKGHFNELFNKEEELSKKRLSICEVCKLYKKDSTLGEICNSKLFVDQKQIKQRTILKKIMSMAAVVC